MLLIDDTYDFNKTIFNEDSGYHIIPNYGPLGGHLKKLRFEILGCYFDGVQMM